MDLFEAVGIFLNVVSRQGIELCQKEKSLPCIAGFLIVRYLVISFEVRALTLVFISFQAGRHSQHAERKRHLSNSNKSPYSNYLNHKDYLNFQTCIFVQKCSFRVSLGLGV
jgi:hypothetical protein